jgi:hypothetical protein
LSIQKEKFKADLESLIEKGGQLQNALTKENYSDQWQEALEKAFPDKKERDKFEKSVPSFKSEYQIWYSEAKALVSQLIPHRLDDFIRHYQKPKSRKEIGFENYRIEDALQGLVVTNDWHDKRVGPEAAIPHFDQQLAIIKSIKPKFESSLFEIYQLVQADLFDSELDAARELLKKKFYRAAGALAGVVLESHLGQVCSDKGIKFRKKNLTISDFNDALKQADSIGVPDWRFIQHLGDLRNLCDHKKPDDPTEEQIKDMITGVEKVTKTIN